MHDNPADELATRLAALLPPEAQIHARPFAQMFQAVAAGSALPAVLQSYLANHGVNAGGTVQALAGHTITGGGTVVSFGSGNAYGDVTIGTVVGGNQSNVTINLFHPPAGILTAYPDPLQRTILEYIARADSSGTPCFVGDIATAIEHSHEIVADEIELLEQAGYVKAHRQINGTYAHLTAAGRKILRTTPPSS